MKGSHVVSIAAIKLGSCSEEVIVGLPQRRPATPTGGSGLPLQDVVTVRIDRAGSSIHADHQRQSYGDLGRSHREDEEYEGLAFHEPPAQGRRCGQS